MKSQHDKVISSELNCWLYL